MELQFSLLFKEKNRKKQCFQQLNDSPGTMFTLYSVELDLAWLKRNITPLCSLHDSLTVFHVHKSQVSHDEYKNSNRLDKNGGQMCFI